MCHAFSLSRTKTNRTEKNASRLNGTKVGNGKLNEFIENEKNEEKKTIVNNMLLKHFVMMICFVLWMHLEYDAFMRLSQISFSFDSLLIFYAIFMFVYLFSVSFRFSIERNSEIGFCMPVSN